MLEERGKTCSIVFASVDIEMTLFADGKLLAVDGRHIERDALESLSPFANMSEMMHFDLIRATADGTAIGQLGLGPSEPPCGLDID